MSEWKKTRGTVPTIGLPSKDSRYSGPNSKKFWDRVNKVPHSEGGMALYIAGCLLQDVEGRVLQILHDCESKAPSRDDQ